MSERLIQLAQRYGIVMSYADIWGRHHTASAATLTALLGAMGVAAADDAQIDAAFAAHESARWHRALPSVLVLREGDPSWTVRVNLPVVHDAQAHQWAVDEEGGARRHGELVPRDLPERERADADGQEHVARDLTLAEALPAGYHTLSLRHEGVLRATCRLIVAPRSCYLPRALEGGRRVWGAAAQLYALRSERNWGIGDFSDLAALLELWGRHGAGIVGVNPLHALFPHNPAHASPYSPSSRRFLNTLYLDVEAIDDYREDEHARSIVRSAGFQARLQALRAAELVDYPGVAAAKGEILELLFAHFRTEHLQQDSTRAHAFRAWRTQCGEELDLHALFDALQEHFHRTDPNTWGWPAWPEPYRRPQSPEVAQFAREHGDRVAFYEYLQWQADLQLGAVGRRSYELGLGVGLYEDLAVSVDRAGAEAWAHQDLCCLAASVGAPPDDFNLNGQNWGLPPLDPNRLRDAAYAPFIATLRANMQHAGALRIDHVMALMRLFWIPGDASAADGAYVQYPFDDLLGIVVLESVRNRCVVIGEDLGTVPDEVRTKLAAAGVLSYRLLYFERRANGDFIAPAEFPRQALVTASTHDLPTLVGWWEGRDLTLRSTLGLYPNAQAREQQAAARAQDRARLLLALQREDLLPPGATPDPASVPTMTPALREALHRLLARAPAQIVVAQLEDVVGAADQVNLPGTTDEHPNWRRKLTLSLERWPGDERFIGLARLLERERGASRAVT